MHSARKNVSARWAPPLKAPPTRDGEILARQWPTLSRAISQYEQGTAERFSRMAYEAVDAGIIRKEQRERLAAAADALAIRSFDAQLLIACAIRKWVLDRQYDATPTHAAPALSSEYRAWSKLWVRLALVACFTVALEGIILWRWLG
jgi:hypothetical protein